MTRQTKTPRQRAEEALAVAGRKVERLTKERDKHQAAYEAASKTRDDAILRHNYLAQDPALTDQTLTESGADK